jgi:SAM-dependent methyltransferase
MLDALEPLAGAHTLDCACGTGVTSSWLAARGATVTGLDLSPAAVARARELAAAAGVDATFVVGDLAGAAGRDEYDRIAGRYALHHIGVDQAAPLLARSLRTRGVAAFVETAASNPLLRLLRPLAGRLGIPRYGTPDEKPLTRGDLRALRSWFGHVEIEVAQLTFFDILDRQLFGYRHRAISRSAAHVDRLLLRLGAKRLSYHQVFVLRRPRSSSSE